MYVHAYRSWRDDLISVPHLSSSGYLKHIFSHPQTRIFVLVLYLFFRWVVCFSLVSCVFPVAHIPQKAPRLRSKSWRLLEEYRVLLLVRIAIV